MDFLRCFSPLFLLVVMFFLSISEKTTANLDNVYIKAHHVADEGVPHMAKKQVSREAKKQKDKWKSKQWFTIVAPEMFNRVQIGETFADDPTKLVGRTIEVTLQDLTGDFKMMHIKLKFKVHDFTTSEAYTRYLGHDLTSDYIRRQTRRKRTKMEGVFDVMTKDGYMVRIKPMAISDKRIQSSVQYLIRKKMKEVVDKAGSESSFPEFVSRVLTSDRDKSLANLFVAECKKIYPIKRVDIRRMDVIQFPEVEAVDLITSIAPVPPPEPVEEPDEGPAPSGTPPDAPATPQDA